MIGADACWSQAILFLPKETLSDANPNVISSVASMSTPMQSDDSAMMGGRAVQHQEDGVNDIDLSVGDCSYGGAVMTGQVR